MYSLLHCWNTSVKENEAKGTRGDPVVQRTWDLPMLDIQVPGRAVGHDLGKKTLMFLFFF